jgi:predicted enzyme related to lactoylglutathione lyase
MGQQVIHFEVIGKDPEALRHYYGQLFGWEFDTTGPVSHEVSEPGEYGFVESSDHSVGIPGGVGGGAAHEPRATFYVGVPDVEAALQQAERLGGKRTMGPDQVPGGKLVVGHFADPEGNLVGLAAIG